MASPPISQPKTQKENSVHPQDPNVLQRMASAPESSVWVGASAGSGKTKVLTDRILRLLLPNKKSEPGTQPHKILALTFTKAGASEMSLRINKRLSEWAVMERDSSQEKTDLTRELKNLLGQDATKKQLDTACKLFARVVDTSGGLKIMTIHSFCQSILSRFPLEAGLTPTFIALEEQQAKNILLQARNSVFNKARTEKGSPLSDAITNLTTHQNEEQFTDLLHNILSERKQFTDILNKNFGVDGLYTAICQKFETPAGKTTDDIIFDACQNNAFNTPSLRQACFNLAKGSIKTDLPRGETIQQWIDKDEKTRFKLYDNYKSAFIKDSDGEIYKSLATKPVQKNNPEILEILEQEALRLLKIENDLKAVNTAALTRDVFMIGEEVLNHYQELKSNQGALDFEDLILYTLDLLQGRTTKISDLGDIMPWVRFKLDQGIDQILVDEAQDTNPEQWEIIKALCDDFFDGDTGQDLQRTVFIVGDKKQSIFSFQRASPDKFEEMRVWFTNKIKNGKKSLESIDFNTSFRSVRSVLQFVDATFNDPAIHKGLASEPLKHESYRYTQAGLVELWPLFESPKKQETDPWSPPTRIIDSSSGAAKMAAHIGETISGWIENKETLESHERAIEAGDIMILVRSRTAFIGQLVRALKIRSIPVSGVDRMILNDELVIQDLYAAANFALLPEDDLNLAGLLKSPFIGWDEDQLFNCAHNRKGTLWQSIKETNDTQTLHWLKNIIGRAGTQNPYEFFAQILQEQCPADTHSGLRAIKKRMGEETLDPIDELLNTALLYEADNIPTIQGFLQEQLNNKGEIKRQMEEAGAAVRIMTIHGAKGLQSPIVILPDTIRTGNSNKTDRLLWPNRYGGELPYFCPTSKQIPSECHAALQTIRSLQDEEYRRLFYVALTRAENRLYIGGYKGSKNPIDESWYRYAEKGFQNLPNCEEEPLEDKKILRFKNKATDDKPDKAQKNKTRPNDIPIKTPEWLFKPMPNEPSPPRPLIPSRPSEKESAALSPLKSAQKHRFLRGNITHKLLQILPDIPQKQRRAAATRFCALPSHEISEKLQKEIITETMAILEDPAFAAIFGEGSMAEVPITGLLEDKILVSGQIDRLLVTPNEILIIDYKTNRPPPKNVKNVPLIYLNQMRHYADIIRQIYKNRPIRTALIWTDGATLMEIE